MAFDRMKKYIEKQKYVSELENKYRRFDKSEMSAIFKDLLKFQDYLEKADAAERKLIYTRDPDEKLNLLIPRLSIAPLREEFEKKYGITLGEDVDYIQCDIEYIRYRIH